MKKTLLLFILCFSFLFADMEGLKIQKDLPTAIKKAKAEQKDILLFIHSEHCFYCKKMKETTFSDKEVIDFINKNYIFVMEKQNSKNLSDKYNTSFVPINYIIDYQDNEILLELPGSKDKNTLLLLLSDYIF